MPSAGCSMAALLNGRLVRVRPLSLLLVAVVDLVRAATLLGILLGLVKQPGECLPPLLPRHPCAPGPSRENQDANLLELRGGDAPARKLAAAVKILLPRTHRHTAQVSSW